MGAENPFVDLRKLVDWFETRPGRLALHIERVVFRLGVVCIPLLGRELCGIEPSRCGPARTALLQLATSDPLVRLRVIAELRAIADSAIADRAKVGVLGLLAELGERGAARFADPTAIQRSSAIALATQLVSPADVASAADHMVRQLGDGDMVRLLAVMAETVPGGAYQLANELCARLDVAPELREQIAAVVGECEPPPAIEHPRRAPRPTHVTVLEDSSSRHVVVASRKVAGERRWRQLAVLIDARGRIDDCLHEDHAGADDVAHVLVSALVADGYRVTSTELEHARDLVLSAARHTGAAPDGPQRLPSAYYVGRDLLDLGEAHLSRMRHPTSATLGRAVELIADGDLPRAQLLLSRCDPASAEVVAASAACLLAQARPAEAIPLLARAIDAEPCWPLHHWNLATACHEVGDAQGCYRALDRFVTTSALPTGLGADPAQPGRLALAGRLMAELERTARLAGMALRPVRRRRRSSRQRGANVER